MGEVAVEVVFAELLGADPAVADRDEVALIVRRTGQLRSPQLRRAGSPSSARRGLRITTTVVVR